jgi:AcrR family transcriptional regulator
MSIKILSNARTKPLMAGKNYHHGALPEAVVESAMRILEQGNAENLSVREVAKDIGVTAMAIYRHFPDKTAFLKAIAAQGLDRLCEAQRLAAEHAGLGEAGFNASGCAYVQFAVAHPSLFRLIMSMAPATDLFEAEASSTPAPMRFLRENIKSLAPKDASANTLRFLALRAWSQVHGLAMLMIDRQIECDERMVRSIVEGREIPRSQTARTQVTRKKGKSP